MPLITRLQRDRVAAAAQALDCDLRVVDQGDDDLTILSRFALQDDDRIALERANEFPDIEVELLEIPCASNPLGIKGAGDAAAWEALRR